MKRLSTFWQRDTANKLITLLALSLALGVAFVGVLVLRMPEGKSLRGALAEYLPGFEAQETTLAPLSTATSMARATAWPDPTARPTAIQTSEGVEISTPTALTTAVATPSTEEPLDSSACIPQNPRESGLVLEILDGNTIKVLIGDKVYVVRYLGVLALDAESPFQRAAVSKNAELVYGQDITLVADVVDKDAAGRLLRYVQVGETFVNLELIGQGLGVMDSGGAPLACGAALLEAGEIAVRERRGNGVCRAPRRNLEAAEEATTLRST
jgi:endonuclease YncB( thermonuclease family)